MAQNHQILHVTGSSPDGSGAEPERADQCPTELDYPGDVSGSGLRAPHQDAAQPAPDAAIPETVLEAPLPKRESIRAHKAPKTRRGIGPRTESLRHSGARGLPVIGETVAGKYLIESVLGAGGMGAVFGARHVVTGRCVALKCLLPCFAADSGFRRRLLREAQLTGRARHPNIVDVYDVEWNAGNLYLVMELLNGEPLSDLIERESLSLPVVLEVFDSVLGAVAWAHDNGIVHRDLKPQNIFICSDPEQPRGLIKVLDFGIARRDSGVETDAITRNLSGTLGTPRYMAPERFSQSPADARSDVYSLGLILLELLLGNHPLTGTDWPRSFPVGQERIRKALQQLPQPVPEHIQHAVLCALSLEPTLRFASASQFRLALAEPTSLPPVEPARVDSEAATRKHSRFTAPAFILLGCGTLAALLSQIYFRPSTSPESPRALLAASGVIAVTRPASAQTPAGSSDHPPETKAMGSAASPGIPSVRTGAEPRVVANGGSLGGRGGGVAGKLPARTGHTQSPAGQLEAKDLGLTSGKSGPR